MEHSKLQKKNKKLKNLYSKIIKEIEVLEEKIYNTNQK